MKQDVIITVRGAQRYAPDETDTTEQTARGTLEKTAEGWALSYEEAGAHTTLTVGERRAVLTRGGSVRTQMTFVPGETHTLLYELAFGAFSAEVSTHTLKFRLTERGGVVEICYALALGGGGAAENRLKIHVRSVGPEEG